MNTSSSTFLSLNNLPGGRSYVMQARAENSAGAGPWSQSSNSVSLASRKPEKPDPPTLTPGGTSLGVSWTAPENNGAAITDYDVRYGPDGLTWTEWNATDDSTGLTATITGLNGNWTYLVQVSAANTHGNGNWSESTAAEPAGPGPPTALTLAPGNGQLTVSWSAPTINNTNVNGYDVEYRVYTMSRDGDWSSHSHTGTTATIALTNGTKYEVRVRAKTSSVRGPWVEASETPGRPDAPSAPTLTAGSGQLTVSWTAPATNGLAITDYDVQYSSDNGSTWTEWNSANTNATPGATITGLTAGTYQVRVRAASSAVNGPWSASSASLTVTTAPSAPGPPSLASGTHSFSATWTEPDASGGSPITGYDLRYSSDSGSTWTELPRVDGSAERRATVTNCNHGTIYTAQVRAVNAVGPGDWSASASVKPGAPTIPLDIWVHPANTALDVSWLYPSSDHGSPVTDYDVRYRAAGSSTWTEWRASTTSTAYQKITGLTNGTKYQVQARAENANGPGAWSASITADPGAPARPVRPKLTGGNGQLAVSWSAPSDHGAAITDYDVRYSSDRGLTWTEWSASTTSTATSATITGLHNGVTHYVQVRAANARGDGPWSESSLRKPLLGPEFQACKPGGTTTLIHGGSCDIKAGRDGVKSFDAVTVVNAPTVAGEPLLAKNRERPDYINLIAINPNGGTATVATTLAGVTQDTFTVTLPAFGINRVTASSNATGGPGNTFNLSVQLDYPDNLAGPDRTNSGQPLRSWVQLGFPGGSGFVGSDYALNGANSASSKLIVGQHQDTVEFTVVAGSTPGMFNITVTAYAAHSGWWCSATPPPDGLGCYNPVNPTDTSVTYAVTSANTTAVVTAQAGVAPVPPERATPTLIAAASSLTAEWTAPDSPAAPIAAYEVQYRHHPDGAWTLWESLGADARSSTITGLDSGGTYGVRIRARNAFGWGDYSVPAEVTLPEEPMGPPAAPTGLDRRRRRRQRDPDLGRSVGRIDHRLRVQREPQRHINRQPDRVEPMDSHPRQRRIHHLPHPDRTGQRPRVPLPRTSRQRRRRRSRRAQ